MVDWKRGGWTGSLNGWVRREIKDHFRDNALVRRARYPFWMRILHVLFDTRTFAHFVVLYTSLVLLLGLLEILSARYVAHWIPIWTSDLSIKSFLTSIGSYLITAQVGVLGVVAIAIGLVTIVAQRENASTDVQIYYHESFAFGVVASSLALLAVLCVQLIWPVQFAIHWFGEGIAPQFFKVLLTVAHIAWLVLNLGGLAHFVATTLAFVQQSAREELRERYTTNVVLPVEMKKHLRGMLYVGAGPDFVNKAWRPASAGHSEPIVFLGTDFGSAGEVEVPCRSGTQSLILSDVRMRWVEWVICRWLRRSANETPSRARLSGLRREVLLVLPPRLDEEPDVDQGICRRRGGVPFTRIEKLILRHAFKFRRKTG